MQPFDGIGSEPLRPDRRKSTNWRNFRISLSVSIQTVKRILRILAACLIVLTLSVGTIVWLHRGTPVSLARRDLRPLTPLQAAIVKGERDQLTWGTGYDGRYCQISYPGGDVPKAMGACTDVVIRAYRYAGIDLQRLIHEDMVKAWKKYPRYHGLAAPDTNIDQRRVPNQAEYFRRHWKTLTCDPSDPKDWQAGDVVEWKILGHYEHTGLLCDDLDSSGFPMVVDNLGSGPHEEDVLRALGWKVTGHFRCPLRDCVVPRKPAPSLNKFSFTRQQAA